MVPGRRGAGGRGRQTAPSPSYVSTGLHTLETDSDDLAMDMAAAIGIIVALAECWGCSARCSAASVSKPLLPLFFFPPRPQHVTARRRGLSASPTDDSTRMPFPGVYDSKRALRPHLASLNVLMHHPLSRDRTALGP